MPSRRAVLGATAAAGGALAGCISVSINEDETSDEWARLTLYDVSDREIGSSIEGEFDVPEEVVHDVLDGDEAFTTGPAAISNGSGVEGPDGALYELSLDSTDRRWSEYAIGFREADDDPERAGTAVGDLPAVDRALVEAAFADGDGTEPSVDGTTVDAATTSVFGSSERERSRLVDGPTEIVVLDGTSYDVRLDRQVVLPGVATVAATRVASDAAAYGRQLSEERAVELSDLPANQRDVVEAATVGPDAEIGDGYRIEEHDDAFAAVVRRLREAGTVHDALDVWLVRYEGETYLAELTAHGLQVGEDR